MEIQQIVLTAERKGRLPLFTEESHYFEALHRLAHVSKGCLVLFALIAEHIHLVALLSRAAAGRLAQAASLALRPIVKTPLAKSYIDGVDGRGHMYRLVRYELDQPRKHRMPGPAALWPGSCLPELVGARFIPGLGLRIREALPTFSIKHVLSVLGLPGEAIAPADLLTLRAAGATRLVTATAAALGANMPLKGNREHEKVARFATVQLADEAAIPAVEVRATTGMDNKTLWRLRQKRVRPAILEAVKRRVTLENLVQRVISTTAG